MPEPNQSLLNSLAQNYLLFLADFPYDLKPDHLDAPPAEQNTLFTGLTDLHQVIGNIYQHFAQLGTASGRLINWKSCSQAIEDPPKLLWGLGVTGQFLPGEETFALKASHTDLDQALKRCGGKDPARAFAVLKEMGFEISFEGPDGRVCEGGYKKCVAVSLGYPIDHHALLRALLYYAPRLPRKSYTQKSIIFEVFLRADFRPLLPDYTFRMPHLPAEEKEATRTFDPTILKVWQGLRDFMADHYPQYHLYFRVPIPGGRRWVADYSNKDGDYGLWSIFVDEAGLSVRIVFNEKNRSPVFEHIGDFSPGFQEELLRRVACKDCVRCGKHFFVSHGDHVHRICKSPWYSSSALKLDDLPDIERLVGYRLDNPA